MDDAGPRHAADAAELPRAMMQQRVDERVFLVAGGGMHDQPGGLVQHEQRVVLEKNVERHVLRLRFGGAGFGPVDFDTTSPARGVWVGLTGAAVDADVAFLDQPLDRAARHGGKLAAQKGVEPLGRQGVFDGQGFGARGHGSSQRSVLQKSRAAGH